MIRSVFLGVFLLAAPAVGAPAEDHWGAPPSADFKRAADFVKTARYDEALPILRRLVEETPGDADVFNLLGFSYRKTGALDEADESYARALRLSPDHVGALAYHGELFLLRGDVAAAEANLARLASICQAGCEERSELSDAIQVWKAAQK